LVLATGGLLRPLAAGSAGTTAADKELGKKALGVLMARLRDPSAPVRAAAAQSWGAIGNPAALPVLRKALKDPDAYVRIAAAFSLDTLGDQRGFKALAAIALEGAGSSRSGDPVAELKLLAKNRARASAIEKLSLIGGVDAVRVMEKTLVDASDTVQDATKIALAHLGFFDEYGAPFVTALGDPDQGVRAAAAAALGRIQRAEALPALIKAANDPVANVRMAVMAALGKFDDPADPAATAALRAGAADVDSRVRFKAFVALSGLKDDGSIALLKAALAKNPTPEILLPVLRGLAERGQTIDLSLVSVNLAQPDPDLRAIAVRALEAVPGAAANALLKREMEKDASKRLQIEAAKALVTRLEKMP
jgi:HEAT repeat protein